MLDGYLLRGNRRLSTKRLLSYYHKGFTNVSRQPQSAMKIPDISDGHDNEMMGVQVKTIFFFFLNFQVIEILPKKKLIHILSYCAKRLQKNNFSFIVLLMLYLCGRWHLYQARVWRLLSLKRKLISVHLIIGAYFLYQLIQCLSG